MLKNLKLSLATTSLFVQLNHNFGYIKPYLTKISVAKTRKIICFTLWWGKQLMRLNYGKSDSFSTYYNYAGVKYYNGEYA